MTWSEPAFEKATAPDGWLTRQRAAEAPPRYTDVELEILSAIHQPPPGHLERTDRHTVGALWLLIGYVLGSHHR